MRIEFRIEGRAVAVEACGDVTVSVSGEGAAGDGGDLLLKLACLRREIAEAADALPCEEAKEEAQDALPEEAPEAGAGLYSRLCALRKGLSEAENVPPFVVFKDKTLQEIAEKRPRDMAALGGIGGIGSVKLEKYGGLLLAVIGEGAAA